MSNNNSFIEHLINTFSFKKNKKDNEKSNKLDHHDNSDECNEVDRSIPTQTVINDGDLKKHKADNQQISVIAELKTQNNKLIIVIVALIFLSFILTCFMWNRAVKVDNNRELLYVQMWGDGSYRVMDSLPEDAQIVTQKLIDSLLFTYTKYRYGLIPQTAKSNYGDASLFMSQPVYQHFKSDKGFNVAEVLRNLNPNSNMITIEWRGTPDHYDAIEGKIGKDAVDIMKSNIYITRIEKDSTGIEIKRDYLIIRYQWYLVDKDELKDWTADDLRVNPIGLTILSEELIYDNVPLEEIKKGKTDEK